MRGFQGIADLQRASGIKAKCEILRDYATDTQFRQLLYYALNPVLSYNLSEKAIRDAQEDTPGQGEGPILFHDFLDCCEYLSHLRGMDAVTLRQVRRIISGQTDPRLQEICIKLLSKTLRLGVTAKTVNKVIPGLIPEWEVQQAFPIDRYPLSPGVEFWLTQKLNGVRATWYNGCLVARSGIPYDGLEHITSALVSLDDDAVLDGELTLGNKPDGMSDNEAFRIATGLVNAGDGIDKTAICFTVFDRIPRDDFENATPKVLYSARRIGLAELAEKLDSNCVHVLPVLYHGTDQGKIDELLARMVREDKEGLMVNLDVPYQRTRHRGILKVKRFYTMDLPIVRCEEGSGRLKDMLGAFVLSYRSNEVKVGSGFTDEQRRSYWEHRYDLQGMLCEVKYKEISRDKKTRLESLQFPVFVRLRMDKTEESYG